jgi:DNA-binding YbaB/EbfC family protein
MFKGLGQLASLMQQLPRIKAEAEQLQQRLGQIVAEGDAGAGMVKVRANGKFEILSCSLSDEVLKQNDKEMLEDLIRAAANQALEKARHLAAEETGKLAASFGLPADIGLPGMTT